MTQSNNDSMREKIQDIWIGVSGCKLDDEEINKTVELISDAKKEAGLDSEQISYLRGVIDVDLEQYGTSYSQSQIDWINNLKATLKEQSSKGERLSNET